MAVGAAPGANIREWLQAPKKACGGAIQTLATYVQDELCQFAALGEL